MAQPPDVYSRVRISQVFLPGRVWETHSHGNKCLLVELWQDPPQTITHQM